MITENGLRERLNRPDLVAGTMVFEFFTPGIGHILKDASADFAVLDMEHSGVSFAELRWVIRGFEAANLPAIVRVPTSNSSDIARALDIGADGIMVPNVESADVARNIVTAAKYAPRGKRGMAQQVGHDRYHMSPMSDYAAAANERTTVIAQIESRAGVDAVEEIAATDGIDVVWLGHGDLSMSLDDPGNFTSDNFRQSVDKILSAAKGSNKRAGRLVPDAKAATNAIEAGFDLLLMSADVKLLHGALSNALNSLRTTHG